MSIAIKCSKELYEYLEINKMMLGSASEEFKKQFRSAQQEAESSYDPVCKFDCVLPRDHIMWRSDDDYLILFD